MTTTRPPRPERQPRRNLARALPLRRADVTRRIRVDQATPADRAAQAAEVEQAHRRPIRHRLRRPRRRQRGNGDGLLYPRAVRRIHASGTESRGNARQRRHPSHQVWFSVSLAEQRTRFAIRLVDPLRHWTFSDMDMESIHRWQAYTEANEEMILVTDTDYAPWIVVNSNDKSADASTPCSTSSPSSTTKTKTLWASRIRRSSGARWRIRAYSSWPTFRQIAISHALSRLNRTTSPYGPPSIAAPAAERHNPRVGTRHGPSHPAKRQGAPAKTIDLLLIKLRPAHALLGHGTTGGCWPPHRSGSHGQ